MHRCPNGTRRSKKTGNCESKSSRKTRCSNGTRRSKKTGNCESKSSKKTISNESLDFIIGSMNLSADKVAELNKMRPMLKKIKYTKAYKSCFTGKSTRDIDDMIATKIQCWAKYGDDI